jgi:hypothetical protein
MRKSKHKFDFWKHFLEFFGGNIFGEFFLEFFFHENAERSGATS